MKSRPGIDATVAQSHTTTESVLPPKYPPRRPSSTPIGMAMSEVTMPTWKDMRAPCTSRCATSRPRLSVPIGCAHDGGW